MNLLFYCLTLRRYQLFVHYITLQCQFCWFQIHIDAHADDDNPEYVAGMPFFRYPNTDDEISYFMQKNDVFIQVFTVMLRRKSESTCRNKVASFYGRRGVVINQYMSILLKPF